MFDLPVSQPGGGQIQQGVVTTAASPKESGLDISSEQTAQHRFIGLFTPSDSYADAI